MNAIPLRVVRCAGCSELEEQVTALQDALAMFAESQNSVDSAVLSTQTGARETAGEATMGDLQADAPIRDRHVVTIPPKIREAMGAAVGDSLRFTLRDDGTVTIRLMRLAEA